jgi:hypothetical protein
MTNDLRRSLTVDDFDAQGNVTVWDHGPKDKPHKHPLPMRMSSGDAGQALKADKRYALEPAVDDGEVRLEMDRLKNARNEAAKVAAERAKADQDAADRKVAIANIISRKVSSHG